MYSRVQMPAWASDAQQKMEMAIRFLCMGCIFGRLTQA
jgi:hypothetical protein